MSSFDTLKEFLKINKKVFDPYNELFKKAYDSFKKRLKISNNLNNIFKNEDTFLLYKFRPAIRCPLIASVGMKKILQVKGRFLDPPLVVLGDVKDKDENKILLIYSFIWDHDTPIGRKIDLERIWVIINKGDETIDNVFFCSHFEISPLKNKKISLQNFNLKFGKGVHTPILLKKIKYSYNNYPIIHFKLFHEGKNGDVCFFPPSKNLRGNARSYNITPSQLNGVHGWKFPEIWLPLWLTLNNDLINNGICSFFGPKLQLKQLFINNHRIKISDFSLMDYTLKMSINESDRVIHDSSLYYPI
ncbi:MAG: hypothetical protein ACTSYZ_06700 [Candidatus Helarchaeota archaeon]